MGGPALIKPDLYCEEGGGSAQGRPALRGGECADCGYVFFPPQAYGCERCGSVAIQSRLLAGAGRLLASARVHLHQGGGRVAPFTVGSIALDDGPIVRALVETEGVAAPVGARMVTSLEKVIDSDGRPWLDLRFSQDLRR